MLKSIFTSLLLLTLTFGFSQLSTFNIADYKLTDYKYQSLDTRFGSKGNYNAKSTNDNAPTTSKSNFSLGINARYDILQNSRRHQKSLYAALDFNPEIEKPAEDEKNVNMNSGLNVGFQDRFYYNEKRYLEFNINSDLTYSYSKSQYSSSPDVKSYDFRNNASLGVVHGHGRVEDVTNAWKAHRLLTDFEKMGLVDASSIQDKDIIELADLMVVQEQTRFFDRRLKRIEDLTGLSTFLESKNLGGNNMAMFTALYDNYLYGAQGRRLSGQRFSYGFNVGNTYIKVDNISNVLKQNDISLGLNVKYENFKPLKNNNFQFDYNGSIGLIDYNVYKGIDNLFLTTNIGARLAYYPTTRTSLSTSLRVSHITALEIKNSFFRVDWRNEAYYYFSPQVRLSGSVGLDNSYVNDDRLGSPTKSNSFKMNYSLGLNIALF